MKALTWKIEGMPRQFLQNVTFSFLFNGIGIPLAATGFLYPA